MKGVLKMQDSGSQLTDAIKNKDRRAFEAVYKDYYKALYTIAFRYTGRYEIAEEVVHDVFITIWSKADTIKIESSMKSYLIRSVINTSLNYVKKERNDNKRHESYSLEQRSDEEIEERYESEELLLTRLEKALELLPPQCKKVMMMSRFEKLKQQEIADRLNISVKTVKNHLTYGFVKLRQALSDIAITFFILALKIIVAVIK